MNAENIVGLDRLGNPLGPDDNRIIELAFEVNYTANILQPPCFGVPES